MKKHSKKIIITIICVIAMGSIFALKKDDKATKKREIITKDSIMLMPMAMKTMQHGFPGSYEKIYYGIDEEGEMVWDVLNPQETTFLDENDNAKDTILMLSNKVYGELPFDQATVTYKDSNLRKEILALGSKVLSTKELVALISTTQMGGNEVNQASYVYTEPELVGDKVFAPTATIMGNENYGIQDRHHRQKANYYWMSSVSTKESGMAGYISKCGVFAALDKEVNTLSMRLTTNINSEAIVFVSQSTGVKNGKLGELMKVAQNQSYYEYKLTLEDTTQSVEVSNINYTDREVLFDYLVSGDGNRLSAIITDEENKRILYYGQLADITMTKNGTATIVLPDDGKYHVSVFSEQYNGDKKTDYASKLISIDLNEK